VARSQPPRKLIFFTDLDGTLLDHQTYAWTAARTALAALARKRQPLVIVTSKTRAEVMPLLRELRRREPFVVENGGAIFLPLRYFPFRIDGAEPAGKGWQRVPLGTPYPRLVTALATAARRAGVAVRGFSRMRAPEVAERAGLVLVAARRACRREFDEPFVILQGDAQAWPRLRREIRKLSLHAVQGSRFFHILGKNDKGGAVRRLAAWFRRAAPGQAVRTVGIGDSPNDIPLLRAVDMPVLVARPGGRYDRETLSSVPRARRAGAIGPAGWNRAVLGLLEGKWQVSQDDET
jgi:mannosyl-3-phosphoglycerate phosphatase